MALPRRRRRRPGGMGMGQYAQYPGMMSNATPSFAGPEYYGQMLNRPPQDWSRFMPSNFQLAEGGGMHYNMNPYGYGSGGGSGWGGGFGGGGGGGGGPGGGGGMWPPGGGWNPPGGGGPGGGTTPPPITGPGPDGAEGDRGGHAGYNELGQSIDHQGNVIDLGVPWQDTFMAPLGHRLGWNFAGYEPGYGQDMGSAEDDMLDAEEMDMANMGGARPGTPSGGYPNQIGITAPNVAGPPGASWGDFNPTAAQIAGPPGASWGDFNPTAAQIAGPPGASWGDFNTPDDPMGSAAGIAAANAAAAQEAQAMAALEDWGGGMGFLGGEGESEMDANEQADIDAGYGWDY